MASLTGSTIAASYEQLLALPDGGLNGNNLVAITDGDSSVAIGMKVATNKIEIIPGSDDANAFEVSKADGTAVLTVNTSTAGATLTGAFDITGKQTITTADNLDTLSLISTDADANSGPNLRLYRNSGSPAGNDLLGNIQWEGRNNNSQDVVYAEMRSQIETTTDGSEDGNYKWSIMKGGTLRDRLSLNNNATVFNDDAQSVDFRVESDNFTHALFVDSSANRVGIGTNATPDHMLDVSFSDTTAVNATNLDNNTVSGISVNVTGNDTNAGPVLKFTSKAKDLVTGIAHQQMGTATADFLIFACAGSAPLERVRVEAGGDLKVNAGNVVIGTNGKGIDFSANTTDGASVSSEILDDYEEGTYTGAITFASGTISIHPDLNALSYTKIGRMVHVFGTLQCNGIDSPSGASNLNLPFTTADLLDNAGVSFATGVAYLNGGSITNANYRIIFELSEGSASTRVFFAETPGGSENLGDDHIASGSNFYVNLAYPAA